jgi:hypothetical protein
MSTLQLIGLIASLIGIAEFIFRTPGLIKKLSDGTFCRFRRSFFQSRQKPARERIESVNQPRILRIRRIDEFLQGSYRKSTRVVVPGNYDIDIQPFLKNSNPRILAR